MQCRNEARGSVEDVLPPGGTWSDVRVLVREFRVGGDLLSQLCEARAQFEGG